MHASVYKSPTKSGRAFLYFSFCSFVLYIFNFGIYNEYLRLLHRGILYDIKALRRLEQKDWILDHQDLIWIFVGLTSSKFHPLWEIDSRGCFLCSIMSNYSQTCQKIQKTFFLTENFTLSLGFNSGPFFYTDTRDI